MTDLTDFGFKREDRITLIIDAFWRKWDKKHGTVRGHKK